jgi:hypothetical protein
VAKLRRNRLVGVRPGAGSQAAALSGGALSAAAGGGNVSGRRGSANY